MQQIKIQGLTVKKKQQKILKDVTYLFTSNNNYLINGKNGSGKSTLIKQIVLFIRKEKVLSVGYFNQKAILLKNSSLMIQINKILLKEEEELFYTYLSKFENINIEAKFNELSGGQKQLIMLLIILAKKRDIYILDEPFNNLSIKRIEILKTIIDSKQWVIIVDHRGEYKNNKKFKILTLESGKINE